MAPRLLEQPNPVAIGSSRSPDPLSVPENLEGGLVVKFNSSILLSLAAVAMLSGCGSSSNPVSSVPDLDTTPPPSPANLAVQYDAKSQRQMLTWSPSSAPDLD